MSGATALPAWRHAAAPAPEAPPQDPPLARVAARRPSAGWEPRACEPRQPRDSCGVSIADRDNKIDVEI